MSMFEKLKAKIRGTIDLDRLKKDGLIVGNNFHAMDGVIIDPGHCWLIEIGDNVTLAPRVHVLAHDASTKNAIGYTKISNVVIGNNVFVGAGSIILPGVKIDSNTVIGCGSVVSKDLSSGIWVGNPCVKISEYDDWREKHKQRTSESIVYDESYTIGNITDKKKEKMKKELKNKTGGVYYLIYGGSCVYKIRKSDLLITSIILILFRPTIVSQYFLLDKILSSLNNLILIFGLLIWITKKVPTDKWIRCLAVLCGTMSIFTFINNGNMYYVIEPFKTFTSILVLYLMYRKYGEHFFDIAKNTLFLLVIINLFSMLIFPNGILQIHKEANEWYQYDVVWWIFGNKNATILWLLPLNIMAQLSLLKRKRLNTSIIYDMFIIAVTIVSSILSNSSTTIIVVILLSSFILINKISKNLDKILSSKVILSVYIIFTVLVIFSPQLSIFKSVSQIFGKDTTFTGRTTVWSNAILLITSKPLFGYGLFDADTARNLFGGYAFVNTHNTILQVLVTGGLFLFIQYFYTLYLICNKAGCTNDYSKGSLIKWSILIMCLQFSFEAYIDSTLLWMVLSIIYYASSDNQPNSKTYIWGQFRGRLGNG